MRERKECRFIISGTESGANLSIYCTYKGFCLVLDCGDGVSMGDGGFIDWRNIVASLYAKDPDMFGILTEPLHLIFPKTMHAFGFRVGKARLKQVRQKVGYTWLDKTAVEEAKFLKDGEEFLSEIQEIEDIKADQVNNHKNGLLLDSFGEERVSGHLD